MTNGNYQKGNGKMAYPPKTSGPQVEYVNGNSRISVMDGRPNAPTGNMGANPNKKEPYNNGRTRKNNTGIIRASSNNRMNTKFLRESLNKKIRVIEKMGSDVMIVGTLVAYDDFSFLLKVEKQGFILMFKGNGMIMQALEVEEPLKLRRHQS